MSITISRHTETFATAPQLEPQHMAQVAAAGFKTLINNRPDGEAGPMQPTSAQMEVAARAAGMNYHFFPVVMGQMNEQHARDFSALLATIEGPVLAYCRTGTRSSYLWNIAQSVE
jgi:uncharacterized protein (TIGR01244 family)